ncbi:HEAT repeat domain-containing protein [Geminocystis sp. CENA526]|uniref:HEAT repeat domain-containing protein n=1 Tax=Geminocystis sp. CENA526 TaxID=1355871 RepID=UPI003D701316
MITQDNSITKILLPNLLDLVEKESIPLEIAIQILELGSFEEKWVISKVLVKQGENAIQPLKKIILNENADTETRWYGLKILSQIKHPEIILIVTELLSKTQEEDLIILATETLASQGKKSISFLSELMTKSDYRLLATKALTQIPSLDVIPPLLSLLNDEDSTIRAMVMASLRNFDTPEIISAMINALKDYNSSVRKEAVIGLGLKLKSSQDEDLIEVITPLLDDINLSVAQQAVMALSRCQSPHAVKALDKVFHSWQTPDVLKVAIIKALAWIATTYSIQCLGKAIYSTDIATTLEIINVLGRLTKPSVKYQAVVILTSFYYTQSPNLTNPDILQALCYSLKQLSSIECISVLKEIVTHHNLQVSLYAESALTQINRVC